MNSSNDIDRHYLAQPSSHGGSYLPECHEKQILVRVNSRIVKNNVTPSLYTSMSPSSHLPKGLDRITGLMLLMGGF